MVHDPLFAAPFSFKLRRLPRLLPVLARDTRLTLTTTGAVAAHPIKIPARAAAPAQIASIHAVWHTAPPFDVCVCGLFIVDLSWKHFFCFCLCLFRGFNDLNFGKNRSNSQNAPAKTTV
jgi:hypothetical protein